MKNLLIFCFLFWSVVGTAQSLTITSTPPVMCPGQSATLNADGNIDNRVLNFPRAAGQEIVLNNVQNFTISNFTYEFWFQTTDTIVFLTEHVDGQFIYDGQSGQNYAVFPQQIWSPVHRRSSGISVGRNGISVIEHSHQFIASRMNYVTPLVGWHHCAVVYTNSNFELFIDGVSVGSRLNGTSYTDNGYGMPMTVACRPNLGNQYPAVAGVDADPNDRFLGQIDEFRVWNSSLSAAQIAAIYNRKLTSVNMSGNVVNMVFDMNSPANSSINNPTVTVTNPSGMAGVTYPLMSIPQVGGFSGANLASAVNAPISLTYAWTNGVIGNTQIVTPSTPTTYTCAVSYGLGVVTTSYTLGISNPQASITSATTTFCQGDSILLTANNGTSYLWSNGATTPSIYVSDVNTYSVNVTNSDNCVAASTPVSTTVLPTPVAMISASDVTTFCDGNQVQLISTPSDFYLWNNGGIDSVVTITTTDTLQVTLTNSYNCSATSNEIIVTVNPKPIAQIMTNGPLTFCNGIGVTLIAEGGTPLWNNAIASDSLYIATADSTVLTVTNSFGCTDTTWVITHVLDLPIVTTQADTAVCISSSNIVFGANPVGGTWSGNGIGNNAFSATSAGNTSVFYSYTDVNGCTNSDTLQVAVTDFTPVTVGADLDLCLPVQSVDLSLNTSPQGGTWTGDGVTSNGIVTYSQAADITYTYTLGDVCQSSGALIVHFHDTPSLPIIGGATHVCKNVPSPLWSNYAGGNYWSTNTYADTTYVSEAGIYTLTHTNQYGCSSTSSITIVEYPDPQLPIISGPSTGVFNTTYTYSVATLANFTYSWQVLGGTIVSGQGTSSVQVIWDQFSQGTGSVNLTWTNQYGCENSNTMAVNVVATGVEEVSSEAFSIFPNPSQGMIQITGSFIEATTLVSLFDVTGNVMLTQNFEAKTAILLDASMLSNGVYFVQIKNGNTVYCRQLIIAK